MATSLDGVLVVATFESGGIAGTDVLDDTGDICFAFSSATVSFNNSTVFSTFDLSSKSIDDE